MEWIKLKEEYPDISQYTLVIGADIWSADARMHICEVEEKKSGLLFVLGSICPAIGGGGGDAFWSPLPTGDSKEWIPFDRDTYKKKSDVLYDDEVIIRLKNGNKYVGSIESSFWAPSFNQFRYGYLDNISHYMELPDNPLASPPDK